MRILIADDDLISQRILSAALEKMGHQVESARDGKEAWEKFSQDHYEVVILDWVMPGMKGPEVARRIREEARDYYPYVILLTSLDEKENLIEGLRSGADDYLTKPLDPAVLEARLAVARRIIGLEADLKEKIAQLAEQNRLIREELRAASRIQAALLPSPAVVGPLEIACYYRPSEELGGDLLSFFPLSDRLLMAYLLDVSGHGVRASLLSVSLGYIISSKSKQFFNRNGVGLEGESLGERLVGLVGELNEELQLLAQTGQYFTIALSLVELDRLTLHLVSAGQPPGLVLDREGGEEWLDLPGFPVGLVEEADYEVQSRRLSPGEVVVFYSDGITEARCMEGRPFGREALLEGARRGVKGGAMRVQAEIVSDLNDWLGDQPPQDDVSLLVLGVDEEAG